MGGGLFEVNERALEEPKNALGAGRRSGLYGPTPQLKKRALGNRRLGGRKGEVLLLQKRRRRMR